MQGLQLYISGINYMSNVCRSNGLNMPKQSRSGPLGCPPGRPPGTSNYNTKSPAKSTRRKRRQNTRKKLHKQDSQLTDQPQHGRRQNRAQMQDPRETDWVEDNNAEALAYLDSLLIDNIPTQPSGRPPGMLSIGPNKSTPKPKVDDQNKQRHPLPKLVKFQLQTRDSRRNSRRKYSKKKRCQTIEEEPALDHCYQTYPSAGWGR